MKKYSPPAQRYYRTKGMRHYEITNHLGNVMATISDRKLGQSPDGDTLINYYHADLLSAQDYYPGGMLMPGRSYSSNAYRFGMNGQEKDDEIAGNGNIYSALYWEYDSRSIRRWNLDPVLKEWESPYLCFSGNPIWYNDPLGNNAGDYWKKSGSGMEKVGTDNIDDQKNYVLNDGETIDPDKKVGDQKSKFTLLPSYPQRNAVMNHWNKFKTSGTMNTIGGLTFRGTFHEESGVGTENGAVFPGTKGKEVIPGSLDQTVELTPGDYGLPHLKGGESINLIYHFHATAKMDPNTSSGGSAGQATPRFAPYLFNQSPSTTDYNNVPSHFASMKNGGTVLQISNKEGINFLGINSGKTGILLNLSFDQFKKKLPNEN